MGPFSFWFYSKNLSISAAALLLSANKLLVTQKSKLSAESFIICLTGAADLYQHESNQQYRVSVASVFTKVITVTWSNGLCVYI